MYLSYLVFFWLNVQDYNSFVYNISGIPKPFSNMSLLRVFRVSLLLLRDGEHLFLPLLVAFQNLPVVFSVISSYHLVPEIRQYLSVRIVFSWSSKSRKSKGYKI